MAGVGVSSGNGLHNAQVGGVIGLNAVENNYLTENYLEKIKSGKLTRREAEEFSQRLDKEVQRLCESNPTGDACRTGISSQIQYIAMQEAWAMMRDDVSRTANQTFNYLYNTPDAHSRFTLYFNTIDARADFFGAMYAYTKQPWFRVAEEVSRDDLQGLGFWFGNASTFGGLREWRDEAGTIIMKNGKNSFRSIYLNPDQDDTWSKKRLYDEQTDPELQAVHQKYFGRRWWFFHKLYADWEVGGKFLNSQDRIKEGCKKMYEVKGCDK